MGAESGGARVYVVFVIVEARRRAASEGVEESKSGSRAEELRDRIVFAFMLAVVLLTYVGLVYASWVVIAFLWSGGHGEK